MVLDRFSLDGKVALVTGSGRGIGKGISLAFAEAGADLVCSDLDESTVDATADEIQAMGRKSMAITCDVVDGKQVEAMVEKAIEAFGHIDILVNNVGGTRYKPMMQMSEKAFLAVLRFNLLSTFLCSKAAAKVMMDQKSGAIINISSRASITPCPGQIAYGAAKAGVNSFTKTLAWELAPHIRVNGIMVGGVSTEGATSIISDVIDTIVEGTPMKRMGMASDIALAAVYLASSASEWVTGRMFEIDGGLEYVPLDVTALTGR